jgi:hypothetical protein
LQPSTAKKTPPPELVPHSPAMMGVGVLSVAVGGVGFLSAVGAFFAGMGCGMGNIGSLGSSGCGKYESRLVGGLVTAVVLTGVGVPLIVIGNRKEPASPEKFATALPWVGPRSAGLSLRLDL